MQTLVDEDDFISGGRSSLFYLEVELSCVCACTDSIPIALYGDNFSLTHCWI